MDYRVRNQNSFTHEKRNRHVQAYQDDFFKARKNVYELQQITPCPTANC